MPHAGSYVYHAATNRLFRITSTEGTSEVLADIRRLSDGRFRVVWNDDVCTLPTCSRNVFGATFELPDVTQVPFGGFLQPVDAYPTMNVMKAGVPCR